MALTSIYIPKLSSGMTLYPRKMGDFPGLGTLKMVAGSVVTQALLVTYKMLAGISPHWKSLPP